MKIFTLSVTIITFFVLLMSVNLSATTESEREQAYITYQDVMKNYEYYEQSPTEILGYLYNGQDYTYQDYISYVTGTSETVFVLIEQINLQTGTSLITEYSGVPVPQGNTYTLYYVYNAPTSFSSDLIIDNVAIREYDYLYTNTGLVYTALTNSATVDDFVSYTDMEIVEQALTTASYTMTSLGTTTARFNVYDDATGSSGTGSYGAIATDGTFFYYEASSPTGKTGILRFEDVATPDVTSLHVVETKYNLEGVAGELYLYASYETGGQLPQAVIDYYEPIYNEHGTTITNARYLTGGVYYYFNDVGNYTIQYDVGHVTDELTTYLIDNELNVGIHTIYVYDYMYSIRTNPPLILDETVSRAYGIVNTVGSLIEDVKNAWDFFIGIVT